MPTPGSRLQQQFQDSVVRSRHTRARGGGRREAKGSLAVPARGKNFGKPNRPFFFLTRPQWRQQQEGENTDSGKKQYRQRYPAVGPASSQHNLDRVGVENRSVDRYERRKRGLRERFQSSLIFGVGIQRGEIGGHASEKK